MVKEVSFPLVWKGEMHPEVITHSMCLFFLDSNIQVGAKESLHLKLFLKC